MTLTDIDWKKVFNFFHGITTNESFSIVKIKNLIKFGNNDSVPFDKIDHIDVKWDPSLLCAIFEKMNLTVAYWPFDKIYCMVPITFKEASFLYRYGKYGHELFYYNSDAEKINLFVDACNKLYNFLIKKASNQKDFVIPIKKYYFFKNYAAAKKNLCNKLDIKSDMSFDYLELLINRFFSYYEHILVLFRIMFSDDKYIDITQILKNITWQDNFKYLFHIDRHSKYKNIYDELTRIWNSIRIPLIHGAMSKEYFLNKLNIDKQEFYICHQKDSTFDLFSQDVSTMAKNIINIFDKAIDLLISDKITKKAFKYLDILSFINSDLHNRKTYQKVLKFSDIKFDQFIDDEYSNIDRMINFDF